MKLDDPRTQQGGDARRAQGRSLVSAPVLIVDDDDSIRETLRLALEEEGYAVFDASDGVAALTMMRAAEQGMVVLLDHIMPGVDGASVLRQISAERELADRHSYVLITASAHVANLEEDVLTLPMPPVSVVRKPFDLDTLFAAVSEANQRLAPR